MRTMSFRRFVSTVVFCLCLGSLPVLSGTVDLPAHQIQGKAVKVIHVKDKTYLQLKIAKNLQWVAAQKMKAKEGAIYTLYMPYMEKWENPQGRKEKVGIWYSIGPVDQKWREKDFTFKTIALGDDVEEAIAIARTWGSAIFEGPVAAGTPKSFVLKDFDLGGIGCDVEVASDYSLKVSGIMIKCEKDIEPEEALDHLYRVFKKKYGPPDSSGEHTANGGTSLHRWIFGEVSVEVGYLHREGRAVPVGKIVNLSRTIRSYNISNEHIEKLESNMTDMIEGVKEKQATEGASKF